MGAMIQCDAPAPPSSSYGNLNLGDFSDVILRNRELDIRARESAARTEWLRQQTEFLRRQNAAPPVAPPAPRDEAAFNAQKDRELESLLRDLREQHQKEELESLLRARIR
jgi:hypothetical protein